MKVPALPCISGEEGSAGRNRGNAQKNGEWNSSTPRSSFRWLPAALGDARQLAAVGHVTETDTRDTELAEDTARAAVDRIAVAQAHRRRVARELLQAETGGLAALVGA